MVQVFVAGATGNTGKRVVQQLSAKGIKVLAGTRVRTHGLSDLPPCVIQWPNIQRDLAKAITFLLCLNMMATLMLPTASCTF